ncbi:MAG: TraM recognition domain-containing protein [Vicinamibacterales bacterium]
MARGRLRYATRGCLVAEATPALEAHLAATGVPHTIVDADPRDPATADRAAQFAAVERWYAHDWRRIEPKLRTSIVEGVAVFLSLFDDNPKVTRVFCPPKACYDPVANADGRYGRPLPPLATLLEQGKVIALNFPAAMNPGLARALGVMLKQDVQRALLLRIPRIAAAPDRPWRPVLFLCDEYQSFATVGESDPSGDEKFFALSRQAKCIPIVATQSLSSLRSTLPGETWRTLLQTFRTKIFLALADEFSARVAADLCGQAERVTPSYALTEAGQHARVSLLTGRATAPTTTLTAAKTYASRLQDRFPPRVFSELQNMQAVALVYDGTNPQPPTYGYLKPAFLDRQTSYFGHRAAGRL